MTSLSVIIPAYNATRTIRDTLDSVVAQTLAPLDVIVVDDGSTDDTAAIAESYRGRLPNLQVIRTTNGRVARARNIGIAASTGELLAPLDADDIWHPTYIEKAVQAYERQPLAGFIYAHRRRIDENGRLLRGPYRYQVEGQAFYRLLTVNFVGSGSNAVIPRRQFDAVEGGYDISLPACEDIFMLWQIAWRAPVVQIPEFLVGYRLMANSMSQDRRKMARGWRQAALKLLAKLPSIDRRARRWLIAQTHIRYATILSLYQAEARLEILWNWAIAYVLDRRHAQAMRREVLTKLEKRAEKADREAPSEAALRPLFLDVSPTMTVRTPAVEPIRERLRMAKGLDRAHDSGLSGRVAAG